MCQGGPTTHTGFGGNTELESINRQRSIGFQLVHFLTRPNLNTFIYTGDPRTLGFGVYRYRGRSLF